MTTFKLGKQSPKFDNKTLLFGKYLTAALPPPPVAVDYSKPVSAWPMMGNDQYGDCTCAAAGHMIEEWTANTATEKTLSDQQILDAYNHFAKGNADAGANMLDVLKYWRKTGIGGDKITAFTQLEPKNDGQTRDAINIFGNCYVGVALPNFAVAPGTDFLQTPWVVPPQGPVGNAAPNPQNGHCIPAVGYDSRNLYVVTWGALKSMSWQFYDAYMDEAFAVLSADWISAKVGKSPSGFNMAALQQDLAAVTGTPAADAATA
jgi:hypothetical protein